MLQRSRIAVLLLASVTLFGCSKSGPPKDASDWSYTPPDGLQQQSQQDRGDTVFNGPKESGFVTNLRVKSGENKNQSAEQIGKDILTKIQAQQGVKLIEQEPYSLPDADGYTWEVSKTSARGNVADQRQFIVVKNGVVVLFTLTAAESAFSKWDQALADSLKSFRWGR